MKDRYHGFPGSCAAVLLTIALSASSLAAQTVPTARLDSIASANLERDRTIGAVAGIGKSGDTLFLAAYGKADIESDTPMRTDAIFGIGSITAGSTGRVTAGG